jgi:hypothetical protein
MLRQSETCAVHGNCLLGAVRADPMKGDAVQSLLGIDLEATRPAVVAVAFGAATLVLIVRGSLGRRRPQRATFQSEAPSPPAAVAMLETAHRRSDITREDYLEPTQGLRGD